MSENDDVVVLDEELPKKELAPTPKPVEKAMEPPKTIPDQVFGKAFFERFGGKAPHYRLAGTFHIHDIEKEDQDKCRLFDTWAKPKRLGLTVEWAEKMRKLGKLVRLELPFED